MRSGPTSVDLLEAVRTCCVPAAVQGEVTSSVQYKILGLEALDDLCDCVVRVCEGYTEGDEDA
jgi:hypothetical protein